MFIGLSLILVVLAVLGVVRGFREADQGQRTQLSAGVITVAWGVGLIAWFLVVRPGLAGLLS